MTSAVQQVPFDSRMDGTLSKVYRANNLWVELHRFRIADDHAGMKTVLDALFTEVVPYLKDAEFLQAFRERKQKAQGLLLSYVKWASQSNNDPKRKYHEQRMQLKLEEGLDEYAEFCMTACMTLGMDMKGKRDLRTISMDGQI